MSPKTSSDNADQLPDDCLLTIREVSRIVGLGSSAIYSRIADGRFPAPRRLSARCSRWRNSEIKAFVAAL